MTKWKSITEEIRRPVVVTNNLMARDAHGHMSHLWVTSFVQRAEPQEHMLDEGFVCFDGWNKVIGLTHYSEIAPPPADIERPDADADECDIQAAMTSNSLL